MAKKVDLTQDDDFEFGKQDDNSGSDTDNGDDKSGTDDKDDASDDNKSDDDKEKGKDKGADDSSADDTDDKDDKDDSDSADDKTNDKAGNKKDKSTDNKKSGKDDSGADDNDDIFAPDKDKADDNKKSFSFKILAKKYDIDLENDTEEEFDEKIAAKFESTKQEIAVDKFAPDAQKLIKHLHENGGKVEDFFKNKTIMSLQGVIGMDPETKVTAVRVQELVKGGMAAKEAREKAAEEVGELTKKELREMAEEIDSDANKLIDKEIDKVIGDRQKIVDQQRSKEQVSTTLEIKQLKSIIEKQESFFGLKLTPEAKKAILADIDSGEFDKIANKNKAQSKFNAYMLGKFGEKIQNRLKTKTDEQARDAHNKAVDKMTDALHNTKSDAQKGSQGRQKSDSSSKKNFDSWSNDLFEGESK